MNPGSICAYCIHFPVSNNYLPTAVACDFVWKYFIYHVRRTVQLFGIKLNHEISIIANYLHTRMRLNNLRVLSVTNKITISHPYLCLTSYSWLYLKIIRVIQARGNYNMFRDKKYSIFFSGVRTQRQQSLSLIIIYGILSIWTTACLGRLLVKYLNEQLYLIYEVFGEVTVWCDLTFSRWLLVKI